MTTPPDPSDPKYDRDLLVYKLEGDLQFRHCSTPKVIARGDLGDWWFGTNCPFTTTTGGSIDEWVKFLDNYKGIDAYAGTNHCLALPSTGTYVQVFWDPMCPSCLDSN